MPNDQVVMANMCPEPRYLFLSFEGFVAMDADAKDNHQGG